MRTIDPILKNGLANQRGEFIARVKTWTDQAAYAAAPNTPEWTWTVMKFKIEATRATCVLVTENDYQKSAFEVFIIERGLKIDGVEYVIESGLYFVEDYREDYGTITLGGSSFPNLKISVAGDDTYENVITAFCTAIGKTAEFKNAGDAWLNYNFFPTGKSLTVNKAQAFENLIKQKYCLQMYEDRPNNLIFYNQDSFDIQAFTAIAWSATVGQLCAPGIRSTQHFYSISDNALTWIKSDVSDTKTKINMLWAEALGLFVTIGQNYAATSPDGVTWTERTIPAGTYFGIAYNGALCVAVGSNLTATSTDGITWTSRTPAAASDWRSVTWAESLGLFVAVAAQTTNNVMTSPDGITWTLQTGTAAQFNSVTWAEEIGTLVAVGSGTPRAMTSTDGINWTGRTAPAIQWKDVAWSPSLGLFAAVGGTYSNSDVMTSPDGATWTGRTNPGQSNWLHLVWAEALGLFVTVAEDSLDSTHVLTSPDGITWTAQASIADFILRYDEGVASSIIRDQSAVHFIWRDEANTTHTDGDTSLPQWNLGYLESTDSPPTTRADAYYKIYLKKAPVRLDITDGDKIHFIPYWSVDPTKTIDAMMKVVEIFDANSAPAWYQEIRSIIMFNSTEGGAMPSTIERVAAYTPLVTNNFNRVLDERSNNLQAFAEAVDELPISTPTNTYWDDLRIEPTTRAAAGAKVPTFAAYKTTLYLYDFDDALAANEKEIFFTVQLPHAWKEGSTIHPHVHWINRAAGTAGQAVRWGLEYTLASPGGTFGATTTIYGTSIVAGGVITAADSHLITPLGTGIDMTGKTLSTIIICRLFRNSSNAADTYTGTAALLYIDCHVEMDSPGSDEEFTK